MKKILLLGFSFVFVLSAWAQERVISGKVTSTEDGSTLPGVNVVLKGTTNGTVTDSEGVYRLTVPSSGGTLVFSFIGLKTQEVGIGERTIVDISLASDIQQLSEVVVTAVGIEREKKALGYSVTGVGADQIAQRSEVDPLRALQGKMPGVNIIGGGGAPGQSTKINIRGASSLTGNTQPLFIVDGIPFDNSVNATGGSSENTVFSNRAFDIDPNNIESFTVLKGAAAAALYGSRATNGVVVITTKAGKKNTKKGLEITYNGSLNFQEISGIPNYQDVYTQGSNQVYNGGFIGNWGAPFPNHVDELNSKYGTSYVKYYGVYGAGPKNGQPYPDGTAPHPLTSNSFAVNLGSRSLFPNLVDADGYAVPYEIKPHDIVGGFFKTGKQVENSLNISAGNDKASVNTGFSRMNQEGIVPNQEATRTTLYFGGNAQLENGLFVSGNVNYVNTAQQSPQSAASAFNDYYGGEGASSIYARIFYLPRNYDLNGLPFESPVDGSNMFYRALDNPLWIAKYNLYTSDVNRVYGNITAKYDVTDWLELMVKGGVNTYTENRRNINRPGGSSIPLGRVWTEDLTNTEIDFNYIATVSKDFSENLNFKALIGFNNNQRELSRRKVTGNQIIQPGLYLTSATSQQTVNYDYHRLRRLYGAYFDMSLSYKDYLFFNLVGRNDWSSTLPKSNNSYFYPGASLSFIFTDALSISNNILDYGKIRVAATKVGNDANPYLTFTNFFIGTPYTTPSGTFVNKGGLSDLSGNPLLKPEFTTEYEIGTDLKFWNKKIGLDLTYFNRQSTEQIALASVARSSGFSQEVVNVGRLDNKGWEVGLEIIPVSNAQVKWSSYFAFTRIRTEVVDAGPTGEIFIGGAASTFGTIHRNGQPYGQIFGTKNARDEEGNLLIDKDTGLPFAAPQSGIIGNPNPDFTLGWTNTVEWKNFTLTALIDWKQGGDFYSFTGASLLLRGQLGFQADREALRVVPGVYGDPASYQAILDENGNKIRNTTAITAFDSHFSNGWGAYGQDEVNIYDGTVIRLREVSLGYRLPKTLLTKTPFGSARISVSGRNLWWKAPNVLKDLNLDPEFLSEASDSNIQGFEYGATPTTRRYGFNITLTF
ncbi:MAG: SusC/RagA family TonB-linked outer membrane protein [Cytophagales bacterium]|nr:SusC/RagA family TonB-linked outer membrane protein [Cytophagales bacterium]